MSKSRGFGKFGLLLITLLGLVLGLAACEDKPVDRRAEIEQAVKATGRTIAPTVDPTIKARDAFQVDFVIFGIRDYYPEVPGELIRFQLLNQRATSIYLSQFCNTVLQRQNGPTESNQWDDIAYGRPCPPNDTNAFQLKPRTSIDASFEFGRTVPFKGKSWLVPGTYRLLVTYYMLCPDAYTTISYCEDRRQAQSNYFQLKLLDASGVTPTAKP